MSNGRFDKDGVPYGAVPQSTHTHGRTKTMGVRRIEFGHADGARMFDEDGQEIVDTSKGEVKPIVLHNADNTVAEALYSKEDLIKCMQSERYRTSEAYRAKIAELLSNSDPADLEMYTEAGAIEKAAAGESSEQRDLIEAHRRSLFDSEYHRNPIKRAQVKEYIATHTEELDSVLGIGGLSIPSSLGEIHRVTMTKDEPTSTDNSGTDPQQS